MTFTSLVLTDFERDGIFEFTALLFLELTALLIADGFFTILVLLYPLVDSRECTLSECLKSIEHSG
ncbi:MAG: hypothetical protein ABIU06_01840, partial [Anaerolineales bacterium]